jgi:hypothetical protein
VSFLFFRGRTTFLLGHFTLQVGFILLGLRFLNSLFPSIPLIFLLQVRVFFKLPVEIDELLAYLHACLAFVPVAHEDLPEAELSPLPPDLGDPAHDHKLHRARPPTHIRGHLRLPRRHVVPVPHADVVQRVEVLRERRVEHQHLVRDEGFVITR